MRSPCSPTTARRRPARARRTVGSSPLARGYRLQPGAVRRGRRDPPRPDHAASDGGDAADERGRPRDVDARGAGSTTASTTTRSSSWRRRRSSPADSSQTTQAPVDQELLVGAFSVENLDPGDGLLFGRLAGPDREQPGSSPDLVAIEEVQDSNGTTNNGVVGASQTWQPDRRNHRGRRPALRYRQIDGEQRLRRRRAGGNIRVGFLFRTDRDLKFIDRPGGTSTNDAAVVSTPSGPELTFSPGRLGTSARRSRRRGHSSVSFSSTASCSCCQSLQLRRPGSAAGRPLPTASTAERVARHRRAQVVNDFIGTISWWLIRTRTCNRPR